MGNALLSQKFYHQMKNLEQRYPHKGALLLPALHAAQDELGWLSSDALSEIGDYLQIPSSQVKEVASFYSMYSLSPVGKYHLKICTNVACWLRGCNQLVDHCEKKLRIKLGETTADKKFTLSEEECLGACATAPVILLNHDYHENLNISKLDKLLDGIES